MPPLSSRETSDSVPGRRTTAPGRSTLALSPAGEERVVRRGVRTAWFPTVVVMLVLAAVLAVVALGRSIGGADAPSLRHGPGLACAELADEGAFPTVEPGLSPVSTDLRLDGRLLCVWPDGSVSTVHYVRADAASVRLLWAALALAAAGLVHAATCTSRRFAVYDA